jgi:hypothetical protein
MAPLPMALMSSTPVQWERGMRRRVAPGVRLLLGGAIVATGALGAQGIYLSETPVGANVALEQMGLVVIDAGDITPIV